MIRFLTTAEVVEEQGRQLELYGLGDPGIIDASRLDSAVQSPQAGFGDTYLFENLNQMAAAYLVRLVKAHAFGNANKRTGLSTSLIFLAMNGFAVKAEGDALIELVIAAATGDGTIDAAESFFQASCEAEGNNLEFAEASTRIHEQFGSEFARLADM